MPEYKNEAAWIVGEKAHPLEVRPGPTPAPDVDEIVIKVAYAAVNPTDWKMQDLAYLPLEYPFIFGTDVSGTVVEVGSNVTRFSIGQRVIGHCDSLLTKKVTHAGYQLYTTCRARLVCELPDSLPLANGAVLPLGIDTAATILFEQLKLPFPSLHPRPLEKTILIWGGSSSVGSCAIQLAVAAGLRVITTASKHNFDYVKRLGAAEAYDHRDLDVVKQLKAALSEGDYVADCISSPEAQSACAEILSSLGGGMLPIVYFPNPDGWPANVKPDITFGLDPGFSKEELLELGFGWGNGAPQIGEAVWQNYLPAALLDGKFLVKPDPYIIKGGLSKVQEGIDILRKGVSAKKVVVEIGGEA